MSASVPSTLISARTAGVIYLAIIALGLFGEAHVRGSLVMAGDPAATANSILASQLLWRAGIAGDLLMHVLDVPLIVFFYLLLKPVSHPLALLATAFNVVQTCVLAINKLALVAALSVLDAPARLSAIVSQDLAVLAINLHNHGFAIGLVFFGMVCLIRGYLVFKAGYVPRILGVLLALAGASYLINSSALLVFPPLAATLFPAVLLPAFVAELALSLWLLFVDEATLQQRLANAAPGAAAVT